MSTNHVLVSGASFAGLTAAYWLSRQGYQVTLIEVGEGLKKGGTPVDIVDDTVGIMKRMGLLDQVREHSLPARATEFRHPDESVAVRLEAAADPEPSSDAADGGRYEVPRDDLLRILFDAVRDDVEVVFGDSIANLAQTQDGVHVTFRHGPERTFAMVIGCDGNHSLVRRLCFGDEAQYSHFLGRYFAISIVDKQIIEPGLTVTYSEPGKTVMLNSYVDKTDICFGFSSPSEIAYDYRDQSEQRSILVDRFADDGGRVNNLLDELKKADNFYFDKLCQIKMPRWTVGRVALVGDAAYCASPAAGMGGSLAIVGATALADALQDHPADLDAAFAAYDRNLRPFVEGVQAEAVSFGLATFFPDSQEEIEARNEFLRHAGE